MNIEFIEWEDEDGCHVDVVQRLARMTHPSSTIAMTAAEEWIDTYLKAIEPREDSK